LTGLLRPGVLLIPIFVFVLVSCGPKEPPPPPNVLLITIDTLRAGHLSSYGYDRETSPVIDRLAAEGVRFENAQVQWPKTGPSFTSIFTATYPKNNGIVRKIGLPLPDEFLMLAEVLRGRGYATRAVVANGAVASDFNFHQGFDSYVETWKLPPDTPGADPNRAEAVTRLALREAQRIDESAPYFLWVHYIDPHFPYEPPPEARNRFQGDEWFEAGTEISVAANRERRDMTGIGTGQVLDGQTDLAFYFARYDAEIAYTDSWIGELLDGLEGDNLLRDTLTVVTSDHGESLGEHYYYFDHGRFGFQNALRVPLIVHWPGRLEPRVDSDPVESIHLAPTLLEAAGEPLEGSGWMQGVSLLGRLTGDKPATGREKFAFSEAGYGRKDMWQRIVRGPRFKLIDAREGEAQRWTTGEVGRQYALFDLANDPTETENVLDQYPDEAQRLERMLTRWYETPFHLLGTVPEAEEGEMDETTREQLRALGYLQ